MKEEITQNFFPRDWANVLDGSKAFLRVREWFTKKTLPQVILFEGKDSEELASLASGVSALHFCEEHSACNKCYGCQDVRNQNQPDLLWVETDENSLKLSDAALIQEHLASLSSEFFGRISSARVVVIIDIDKMNLQASNRLLKTLEEPQPNSRIIMTTTKIKYLLPTIKSRCVRIKVPTKKKSAEIQDDFMDNNRELYDLISQILGNIEPEQVIDKAEIISKKIGLSAIEFANAMEIVLNKYYRENLAHDISSVNYPLLCERRRVLSEIKKWAGDKKITLNAQLAIEGVSGIGVL